MNQRLRLIFAALIVLLLGAGAAAGEDKKSKSDMVTVVYVVDGDTVKVRFDDGREEKVRLIGVDTPELRDKNPVNRKHARIAQMYVMKRCKGKRVRLTYDRRRRDRYKRILGYIWIDRSRGGVDLLNWQLIRYGYGPALLKYPFRRDRMKQFESAEKSAKETGLGVWGNN